MRVRLFLFDEEEEAFEVGAFGVEGVDRMVSSEAVAAEDAEGALGF
jgi:hypothetical protein